MKKTIPLMVLLVVMLMFSGCSVLGLTSPSNYVTPDGKVVETTEEMAVIMATRDNNSTRASEYNRAIKDSTRPEQVVALTAGYFGNQGQPITRSKTWDERLFPWMQGIFLPVYLNERAGPKSGKNGVSVDGDGNTIVYSEDHIDNGSSKSSWITPISYKTTQAQMNTGGGQGGTNNGTQPAQPPCVVRPDVINADGTVTPGTSCQ